MLRKLLLILFVSILSQHSFSQANENIVKDTIAAVDSLEEEENNEDYSVTTTTKNDDEIKVLYNDTRLDTTAYAIRNPLNDTIEKLRKKEEYLYPNIHNDIEKKKEKDPYNSSFWDKFFRALSSSTAEFILWTIIIGFMVVVIVMYFRDNNMGLFARKSKSVAVVEDAASYNNIFEINYNKEIQNALLSSNYNVAARLGFLQLLSLLSSKKMIDYGIEKTNFDYQFQLMNTKYYKGFMLAAHNYEYAWYSGYEVNESQYKLIAQHYQNLEEQLQD